MLKTYTPFILAMTACVFAVHADEINDHIQVSQAITFANNDVSRGVSGSSNDPVVQGYIDIAHDSGAYVGLWGTSGDEGGEIDWWGGYVYQLNADYALDFRLARFYRRQQPSNRRFSHPDDPLVQSLSPPRLGLWPQLLRTEQGPAPGRQLHAGYKNYG